ncbi:MAG: CoA-binding protein [Thiobacillus sp.]|nr:CoA-binding protein [Thiobacillus sp.]
MSFANPDDASLRTLLDRVRTIAVVGLSPQPARPSYRVAQAMQRQGYRIVPVRPLVDEVLGAEHVPAIVEQCLALHLPAIWIQEGIVADAAAQQAQAGGMTVVMDRCLLKETVRLKTA